MLTLPTFVEFQSLRYIATRLNVTIPFDSEVDPAFDELWDAFHKVGVEPDGIEFMKFNLIDMPRLEIEVGMTTDAEIPLSGRLVEGELPAGTYVSCTYTGSYEGLYDATAMIIGWAKERGVEWDVKPTSAGGRGSIRATLLTPRCSPVYQPTEISHEEHHRDYTDRWPPCYFFAGLCR